MRPTGSAARSTIYEKVLLNSYRQLLIGFCGGTQVAAAREVHAKPPFTTLAPMRGPWRNRPLTMTMQTEPVFSRVATIDFHHFAAQDFLLELSFTPIPR